jgi:hypothetical protein
VTTLWSQAQGYYPLSTIGRHFLEETFLGEHARVTSWWCIENQIWVQHIILWYSIEFHGQPPNQLMVLLKKPLNSQKPLIFNPQMFFYLQK